MSELVVGIKHIRDDVEIQAVLGAEMSVIGLIGTAPEADAGVIPLNTNILVRTDDAAMRTALGAAGTLADALRGISESLGANGSARVILRRVVEGATVPETLANLVGNEAEETGVWGFLTAGEELGYIPRLYVVPGFTSQVMSGVTAIAIGDAGTGYEPGDVIAGTGGGGSGFTAEVATVGDNGEILTVTITTPGFAYTSAPTLAVTSDEGEGAALTATVTAYGNPVCAVMPTILDRTNGGMIPEGPTSSRQAWLDWLELLPRSQRIFHPLAQDAKVLDADGTIVTRPLSPYIAGLYVRRDAQFDGRPFHSVANQAMNGLVGVTPAIPFSLTQDSIGQDYIARSGGIVVRGDSGVEASLSSGGFIFWGTDTLSEDSSYLFSHVVRGRDYIELTQVKAIRYYLGRFNITEQTVQAIVNTMESMLSRLRADGDILDYRVGFEADQNSPEQLRLGHLQVVFLAEEPPVLRKITVRSRRFRQALEDLVQRLAVQLGNATGA
ncbi:MAG: phage tail protein [Salinarimonadaceae bacterium]|nr:MAG: phage tail protein [Salinarimonadaceae bacterium]